MDPPASSKTRINLNFLVGWASQCGVFCKHDDDDEDVRYFDLLFLWNEACNRVYEE